MTSAMHPVASQAGEVAPALRGRATRCDVIVAGLGAMGSATAWHLARRGLQVVGLEQFDIPHDRGSSHGVNRIFRLAYYEDPSYVPLMRRALDLWRELEERSDQRLVWVTGSVDAGPEDGEVFSGSLRSCRIHDLDHEALTAAELGRRFPGYHLPDGYMAVLQPEGGFLSSELCIAAHVTEAAGAGAEIRAREPILSWSETPDGGVSVETNRGRYEADHLVIAAGAWAASLLPALGSLAVPERQVLGWFQPKRPDLFGLDTFPVFNLETPEGRYYGFPRFAVPGFKIGRYHHLGEVTDPETVDRDIHPEDEEVLRRAIRSYFPDADGPVAALKTCLFTNSPDEHFVVDLMPDRPQIAVAAGFSGHGFKFASVIGEILSDLVTEGDTSHDISRFRLRRFA